MNIADYENKSQAEILEAIKGLSAKIVQQQRKADKEGFETYGGAIGLQRLRLDRKALYGLLRPLSVVITNGDKDA